MDINVSITLFDVQRCGYYRRGKHRFGDVQTLMEDLEAWSANRRLAQTKIFDPSEDSNLEPVYLFSITRSRTGDSWLVVTWNELETIDGAITSVPGNAQVGTATVSSSDVEEGHIPGYPTFFYVLPNEKLIATVPLFSTKAGRPGFEEYLKTFLRAHTRHVVHGPRNKDGTHQIQGYSLRRDDDVEHPFPMFKTAVIRKPGKIDEIRRRYDEIRRIVRKASLTVQQQAERDLWQSMLAKVGLANTNITSQTIDVKYEFNATLTADDLEQMIKSWEQEVKTAWSDIGFQFRGETGSPLWLSSSMARDEFTIRVQSDGDANVDNVSLLDSLNRLRQEILRLR